MPPKSDFGVVGTSVRRRDGDDAVAGKPLFADDLTIPNLLHAAVLTSPHPHAEIVSIDTRPAEEIVGVESVLCYRNCPRIPHSTAGHPSPGFGPFDTFTFDSKVRFVGDRVAAVAAVSPDIAAAALGAIRVEYRLLEPVFDPRAALLPGAPIIHDEADCTANYGSFRPGRNIVAALKVDKGNVDDAFSASKVIVEREYQTHQAQHCCLEPHIAIAYVDGDGRLVIITSTQVPFLVRQIIAGCLELPESVIRIIQPRVGGGFGSKQEMLLEDICAIFATRTRKPVKLALTRSEEFTGARTRHAMIMKAKAGAAENGKLLALDLDLTCNAGAYGTHTMAVVCNAVRKALALYDIENIRLRAKAVYTNLPIAGAYRGYGVPQLLFAVESIVEDLAGELKADPVKIREGNHRGFRVDPADRRPAGTESDDSAPPAASGLTRCLREGVEAFDWYGRQSSRKRRNERNKRRGEPYRFGVGLSLALEGTGIAEGDRTDAVLKMGEDGSFALVTGAGEIGTGASTVLSQIAAEALGIPVDQIGFSSVDTDVCPFDLGTFSSRTTYAVGNAVVAAAADARVQLLERGSALMSVPRSAVRCDGGWVVADDRTRISLDDRTRISFEEIARFAMSRGECGPVIGRGGFAATKSPACFAANFAEVVVDVETGQVRVLEYLAVIDCGTVVNPVLAEGQVEGAVLNGISYALTEEYIFSRNGRVLNDTFRHYKICTTEDLPDIQVRFIRSFEDTGPFGAKSIGEIGICGPLPAIRNAICGATGVRLNRAPFTPERFLDAYSKIDARL